LATKYTRKNKNYNKQDLAKKLDNLAERVSSKNIFVVGKDDFNHYTIVNYKNSSVIFSEIPTKKIANKLCNTLNKSSKIKINTKELYKNLHYYNKLKNDIMFYNHTINVSSDSVLKFTVRTRLQTAKLLLCETENKILNMC